MATFEKGDLSLNLPDINAAYASFPNRQHPIATTRGQPGNPFPRIVIKDNLGLPIDTDTAAQRQLYDAKVRSELQEFLSLPQFQYQNY